MAPEPQQLGCLPCQGPHFSSLPCPELMDFKSRRVISFRKNLIELAELELKHAKVSPPPSLASRCLSATHSQTSRFLPSVGKQVLGKEVWQP